jgi:hypothetical protein
MLDEAAVMVWQQELGRCSQAIVRKRRDLEEFGYVVYARRYLYLARGRECASLSGRRQGRLGSVRVVTGKEPKEEEEGDPDVKAGGVMIP